MLTTLGRCVIKDLLMDVLFKSTKSSNDIIQIKIENYIINGLNVCDSRVDALYVFPSCLHSDISSIFPAMVQPPIGQDAIAFMKKPSNVPHLIKQQYLQRMLLQ